VQVGEVSVNKLQQQSLQAKDARFVTDIIDEGFANAEAKLDELLNRTAQNENKPVPISFGGVALNRDYYNLFVVSSAKFDNSNGSFVISNKKALVESIEPQVKKQFFDLRDDSVLERILSLPSLFMNENVDYKRSRPGQKALFGRVTDIEFAGKDIRISFEGSTLIFLQSVTDISHNLGIIGNPGCSELNNTHWTIKQIDLIKVLTDAGLLASQVI